MVNPTERNDVLPGCEQEVPQPWTVERSQVVLSDRWLTVKADTCTTVEGYEVSPYYLLEYPDWVHMVVIDDDNRILVTELYRHARRMISAELPCGTVEERDGSPELAARRELVEETGLGGGQFVHLGSLAPNPATHTNLVHTFAVHGATSVSQALQEPTENIRCDWLTFPKILNLIDSGSFLQSLHVASLFLAARALEFEWTDKK